MSKEVMQMALDALEDFRGEYGWLPKQEKTIEALRTALAQPEPILVSPKEFIAAVTGKEDIRGIPVMRSVWPIGETHE